MKHKGVDISECDMYNLSEDIAKEWIDYRERLGKHLKLNQAQFNRLLNKLAKCEQETGAEPDEVLTMIMDDKGWRGFTIEYVKAELSRRRQADERCNRSGRDVAAETRGAARNDWAH
jgi:hypothetical protein